MTLDPGRASALLQAEIARGAEVAAEVLKTYAVARAPRDKGPLQDQAHVEPLNVLMNPTYAVIFPVIYAAVQHEATHFNHPRGGQAKFLSSAAEDHAGQIRQIIVDHLKGHL